MALNVWVCPFLLGCWGAAEDYVELLLHLRKVIFY